MPSLALALYRDAFKNTVPEGVIFRAITWDEICSLNTHPIADEVRRYLIWKKGNTKENKFKKACRIKLKESEIRMPVFSNSRLGTFEQCPLKYKYQYIDKIKVEVAKTVEAFRGSCVHEALENSIRDLKLQKHNSWRICLPTTMTYG